MFKPILLVNTASSAITVRADDSRFNTLEDFIEYSRNHTARVGNSGTGAIWHLAAAGLARASGTTFEYEGYDGASPAIAALLTEEIDAVSVSYAEVSSYVKDGRLKILAVMANDRLSAIPDVPTCRECGYNAALGTWRGLGVPASTPDATVSELYRIFSAAADSEEFKTFMANTDNVIEIMDGAEFNTMMGEQLELFTEIVGDLGLGIGG